MKDVETNWYDRFLEKQVPKMGIADLVTRMKGDSVRARVNRVAEVYAWMQEDIRFLHPDEYSPYDWRRRTPRDY